MSADVGSRQHRNPHCCEELSPLVSRSAGIFALKASDEDSTPPIPSNQFSIPWPESSVSEVTGLNEEASQNHSSLTSTGASMLESRSTAASNMPDTWFGQLARLVVECARVVESVSAPGMSRRKEVE